MTGADVVCIIGPTACHKTEVSIALANRMNGEIVSADSVAVYRGLDIGSAKPTETERAAAVHHMIDVADVWDTDYSVSRFRSEARAAIDGICSRGKLPIVVGGSGLYSDAIFSEMRFSVPRKDDLRALLEKEYALDPEAFFARLKRVDAVTAARLHPNDAKRVVRAIEVYELTGKPFSEWNPSFLKAQEGEGTYRVFRIGLNMERNALYQRIEQRVDQMFKQGLIREAYALFDQGYTPDRYPAMQAIGYAQLFDAYRGICTTEEAKERIKLDTRHFAKRQLTWFRRNPTTIWYMVDSFSSISALLDQVQKDLEDQL